MNVLIDENLTPTMVERLAAKGVVAVHVAHIGMPGATDPEVWCRHVTCNVENTTLVVKGVGLLGSFEVALGSIGARSTPEAPIVTTLPSLEAQIRRMTPVAAPPEQRAQVVELSNALEGNV